MSKLTASQAAYIKQVQGFCEEFGMSPSYARVFAWLLICEPEHQSAEDIQKTLRLSVGSVSSAVNVLARSGLVEKLTFPGDRRFYYRLPSDSWRKVFEQRVHSLRRAHMLAAEGLKLNPANERLIKMQGFYQWAEAAFTRILNEERAAQ